MVGAGSVCCSFHAEPGQKDYRAVGDEVLKVDAVPARDVPGIDFLSLAKGCGVEGVRAATAEELKQALTTALASPTPTLIEVPILAEGF